MPLSEIIISDTSCLINLSKIDSISLLGEVFDNVIITEEVAKEYGKPLPDWIEIRKASIHTTREIQNSGLHLGESSSIALALELQEDCLLILDDFDARTVAAQMNLNFVGLLGVLTQAKIAGVIKEVKPYIERLQKVNFRMSNNLIQIALRDAGEK